MVEFVDLEFGAHGFLINHVFLPTEQAETNICWIIYQDENFKICLSLFGWKENILPKMHIVHCGVCNQRRPRLIFVSQQERGRKGGGALRLVTGAHLISVHPRGLPSPVASRNYGSMKPCIVLLWTPFIEQRLWYLAIIFLSNLWEENQP